MKLVMFNQYLLPNGRKQIISIERPNDVADKAEMLTSVGCELATEILTTGEVSMTVDLEGECIAIEVVPNGPGVAEAVDRLILRAIENAVVLTRLAILEGKDEEPNHA